MKRSGYVGGTNAQVQFKIIHLKPTGDTRDTMFSGSLFYNMSLLWYVCMLSCTSE